jgi:hypothetical protein
MGFLNEAAFSAKEGLEEANKQNKHDCYSEFREVHLRIDAMNRMVVPIKYDGNKDKS